MNTKKLAFVVVFILLLMICIVGNASAISYEIRDLGIGTASDINNAGQIIINGNGAWLWSQSSEFIPLPMTIVRGLNDNGEVVGEVSGAGVLWNSKTNTSLNFDNLFLYDINNQGQMVGMSIEQSQWKETFFAMWTVQQPIWAIDMRRI